MDGFEIEYYTDFGTSEPWVVRTMLGLRELVYAAPAFGNTRESFMRELGEVFDVLGKASRNSGC